MVVPQGILEDIGLILAGIIGTYLVLKRDKSSLIMKKEKSMATQKR
jgi:uncharacterized membrane protein SpoIIM required for sporulation